MISIKNKIAFITGASSGIGQACAEQFAQQGARLILAARRVERLKEIAQNLQSQYGVDALVVHLDVRNQEEINSQLKNLPDTWKDIDILVNNAGLALATDKIQNGSLDNWDIMIDTNIRGLLYVTKAILPGMVARNSGHIVNVGSVAGYECYPAGNVYSATKHAVKAISRSMRIDLLGTAVRVSEVDPGAVHTEFSEVRWNDKQRSDNFYSLFTPLVAHDIADTILYCVTRPLHVNVSEIIVHSIDQASVNHLHIKSQPTTNLFDQKKRKN